MYKLHHYPDTAATILSLVLRELAVPFTERAINRKGGELDTPAYRALHPLGKIPALETPDGVMFETAAMLLYLSDRHRQMGATPDSPQRPHFLKYLFFTSTNLHPAILECYYPERTAGPDNADAVKTHAARRIGLYLPILEEAAAANPDWLSNRQPTVLGFYLGILCRWIGQTPHDHPAHQDLARFPAMHRMLAFHETRPAALEVAGREGLGAAIFTAPDA